MSPLAVAFLSAAAKAVPGLVEAIAAIAHTDKRTVEERIARAEAAIKDPIDVSAGDAARREALERALRGDPGGSPR